MNVLKNILFFGLLLAVLCGVYFAMKQPPEQPLPPALSGDTTPPKVEIPGLTGPPLANVSNNAAANSLPEASPPPAMGPAPTTLGGVAPAFQPPTGYAAAPPSVPPSAPPLGNIAPPSSPLVQSGSAELHSTLPPPPVDLPPLGQNYPSGVNDPTAPRVPRAADHSVPSLAARQPNDPFGPAGASADNVPAPPETHAPPSSIDLILQQVELKVKENKLADALFLLSQLYGKPDVPEKQAQKITEVLDTLAAKVIYSREDLLEKQYFVQSNDTLDTIADHYQVPALLLARINGIRDPQNLSPGTPLKVLKGPFSAQISTEHAEMTLMLSGRYAGRFQITLSNDLQHATGLFTVRGKSPPITSPFVAGIPPRAWIELSSNSGKINIEAADPHYSARPSAGRIWLSEQDMDDIYGILSVGSLVVIQR